MLETSSLAKKEWNAHAASKWTYFTNHVKSRISYFLNQRINGKNIDFEGGWYLYYDNSSVVDFSQECLKNNRAKEKVEFNLDDLAAGKKLPFLNNSFDSATFISSWQYLNHPECVVNELKRVLKQGAEVYIINGQGAGIKELIVSHSRSREIEKFFTSKGFDTLIENVYANEFMSVCVKMPYKDVFGRKVSIIPDKKSRTEYNEGFENQYSNYKVENAKTQLSMLETFPVTSDSKELKERHEKFSKEYMEKTGITPLLFLENELPQAFYMSTNDDCPVPYFITTYDELTNEKPEVLITLKKKHGLNLCHYSGYFKKGPVNEAANACKKGNIYQLEKMIRFLNAFPMNSITMEYQKKVKELIEPALPDFKERMLKGQAKKCMFNCIMYNNESSATKLLEKKKRILKEKKGIIGEKRVDYSKYFPYLKEFA